MDICNYWKSRFIKYLALAQKIKEISKGQISFQRFVKIILFGALIILCQCTGFKSNQDESSSFKLYLDSVEYCKGNAQDQYVISPFLYYYFSLKNENIKSSIQIQLEKFPNYQSAKDSIIISYHSNHVKLYTSFRRDIYNIDNQSYCKIVLSPDPSDIAKLFDIEKNKGQLELLNQFINESDIKLYLTLEAGHEAVVIKAIRYGHFKTVPLDCIDPWF